MLMVVARGLRDTKERMKVVLLLGEKIENKRARFLHLIRTLASTLVSVQTLMFYPPRVRIGFLVILLIMVQFNVP